MWSLNVCLCFTHTGSSLEESLKVHRRRNLSAEQYLCTPSTAFSPQETFTCHRKRHNRKQLYTCSQCGKHFSSPKSICAHMNFHTSKFKCTECGRCCEDGSKLTEHKFMLITNRKWHVGFGLISPSVTLNSVIAVTVVFLYVSLQT